MTTTPAAESVAGPLAGLRVLEMGTIIAGPFAARILGDYGADVVKIEPPGRPDPVREWGQGDYHGHRFMWTVLGRNKRCITLDLRSERGQEVLLRLIEQTDIVVENFRPGTLERWNLGYDRLAAVNPGLILGRVSGYGQTGPYASLPGYASVAEAMSGLRGINGYPDQPPPRTAVSLGDSLAGMVAVQGVLAALYRRSVTGQRAGRRHRDHRGLPVGPRVVHPGVRQARPRAPAVGDPARRDRAVEHLPGRRRALDGRRGEPGHRVPAAVRGHGPPGARRGPALRRPRRARGEPGRDRRHRRRLGPAPARPPRSGACSTRPA